MRLVTMLGLALLGAVVVGGACGGDDANEGPIGTGAGGSFPEQTGSKCVTPDDCYPALDGGVLAGEVQCLTRVRGGYCTHLCNDDADCCAVEGECKSGIKQVCSPFESTNLRMCFLSCEPGDLIGTTDDQLYCQREASADFICRSSGGGADNRKVCVPGNCGVGASCTTSDDCGGGGLECVTSFTGGYCTLRGCTTDAGCPQNSRCVTLSGTNYCLRSCTGRSDCDFCRTTIEQTACTTNADFVDSSGSGSVCLP